MQVYCDQRSHFPTFFFRIFYFYSFKTNIQFSHVSVISICYIPVVIVACVCVNKRAGLPFLKVVCSL